MQAQEKKVLKRKTNQGITLVALVITIVTLLILAGITINLLITDNGIFKTAQKAKEEMEKAEFEEKLTLIEVGLSPSKILNGTITQEDYFNELKNQGLITDTTVGGDNIKELEPDANGNNRYEITTEEGDVFEVTIDKDGNIETEYQGKADKLPPRIKGITVKSKSTNHIEVEVTVNRLEDGKLTYLYKKDTEAESSYKELKKNTTDLIGNFTGLEQNVVYNIKVIAENKNGQHELVVNEITGELPSGTITQKGETVWSNGKASIELETSETGYTLQYQINSREGVWQEYTGAIGNLNHGNVVYARLYDGTNGSDTAVINIQDGTAPTVTVTKGSVTTNSITVSVTSSDGQTGMPTSPSYSYYIKKHSDANYPTTASYTGTNTSHTFTGLSQTTGYDIKVTTKDKVNNEGTGSLSNITIGTVGGATEGLREGNITASSATWSNGTASITLSTTTSFQIEWQIGNITEGSWTKGTSVTGLTHNSVVYARLTDGTNVGDYGSVNIQDGTAPSVTVTKGNVTTNSITVSATATDGQTGMPASPSYSYYIKKHSDANYPTTASYTGTNASYSFTGLQQTTGYDVKVTTKDKVNNVGTGTLANITTGTVGAATGGLQTGNITASVSWSGGSATITLATSTGLQIEWQKGGISGSWTKGTSVTGLKNGNVVYARLTDGTNVGDYASINIADGIVPQAATIVLSSTTTTAGTAINATVTHRDNESGIAIGNCKWVYNTSPNNIGTNAASYTGGTFSSNPQTISLNTSTPGTYFLHILSTDVAGNKKETVSAAVTVKAALTTDGSYVASKGVNSPKLGTGMTPIRWNGSSWVEAKTNDEWYNYTSGSKQWANARTSDGSMWVWIPRYAYQIPSSNWHTGTVGTINIKFLQGTSNTASDGTTSWDNTSGGDKWNIHPAFSYGSNVAGIWVAKFEASQSDAGANSANYGTPSYSGGTSGVIKIQPGVNSWRNITVNDIYNKCLSYNSTLNSHQMKNSEWGAVAYLAQSTYGKNSEVWINPNQNYITGQAGASVSAGGTTSTNAYNTTNGVQASTTGNIYGVYDMIGGAWEYVAAYVNNGHSNLTTYGANLVSSSAAAKTRDVYTSATSSGANTQSTDYETAKGKYGDAVYETSSSYSNSSGSWYGDYAGFPYSSRPFFLRGGGYDNASIAGLFYFDYSNGNAASDFGFRPVLVVL